MLSQSFRLPSTIRFSHAKFVKTPLFSVRYAINNQDVSRFGFVVRKSVDKRSVYRNRIRRIFRSCIEQNLNTIVPGYDMLFFLEKGIMDKSQTDLCQILLQLLEERKLLKQGTS